MKNIWSLVIGSLMATSLTFAQDGYGDDYGDDYPEESTESVEQQETSAEPAEEQTEDQPAAQVAEEEKATEPAESPANTQDNAQSNEYAKADEPQKSHERPAQNERMMSFGIRAAFDYAMMYGFEEEDDNMDGTPQGIGFEVGATVRIAMIPNLFFTPEINFAYTNTSHDYLNRNRDYTSMELEVPLLIRGVIAEKFYVTAGPQLNICLSSDFSQDEIKLDYGTFPWEEKIEQGAFTFGLAAGAGYNVVAGLFVDLRFYMGLMDLFPDVSSPDDIDNMNDADLFSSVDLSGAKMMKFKVGLSYFFI